jgi:hypothetical protein
MSPPRLTRLPGIAALSLGLALAFYAVFIARSAVIIHGSAWFTLFDDAMVSMRYAQNLAAGFGAVWNPGGERIEGITNPLWTLVMAGVHLLPLHESKRALAVMVLGAALMVVNALLAASLARRLTASRHREASWICAFTAVLAYYPLVFWSLRGMEVGLSAALATGALVCALRTTGEEGRRPGSEGLLCLCLALSVALRLDALVMGAVVAAWVVANAPADRRAPLALRVGAALTAPLAALEAARLAYYGAWLPNTYYLKVEGVSHLDRLTRGLKVGLQGVAYHAWPYLTAACAWGLARRLPVGIGLVASSIGAQLAYAGWVGGDAWEWVGHSNRFAASVAPAFIALGASALPLLWSWTQQRSPALLRLAGGAVALSLLSRAGLLAMAGRASTTADHVLLAIGLVGLAVALVIRGEQHAPDDGPNVPLAAGLALAVGLTVLGNTASYREWLSDNAKHVADDGRMLRLGLAIRAATTPEARVAVVWAGTLPYFASRHAIDLLGKADPVVAHGPPATAAFFPGHNKWNLQHSLVDLRPDLVVQELPDARFHPTLDRLGYSALASGVRGLETSPHVRVRPLPLDRFGP